MQSDNAIPTLTPPAYPSIAGQVMPDLNLAGISTPQTSLAEGHFTGSTPPQNTAVPPLSTDDVDGDINQLGIDPAVNYFELNLAGNVLPIPDPAKLAMPTPPSPSQEQANAPTFSGPFASVPSIRAFDLTSPGIDAIAPFDADPATGDLLQFDRPRGLFMLAASELPMIADPMLPDLSLYDRPAGLDMPGPLMVDPALPDLQHPTLEQPVAMPGRPADLAPDALAMMHGLPAYEQLPAAHSKALWMAQQGVMHIAGHICEGQTLDARGHDVRVTIIKGGKSINGYYYDEQALQHIAHMIDGARAYADHGRSEADQQTRSVRDMVGFYKDAQHFPHAAGSPHGRVDATLHMLEAAAWLWSIIQEAVALDRPDLIGLSIDIFGNWQPSEERQAKQVTRVLSLNSCDNSDTSQAETPDQSRIMEAQQAAIQAALAEISREKCALRLERRLMESQLPEAAQQHLRQQFGERIFENTELETSMSNLRSMLAGLGASGIITGNGYEKPATGHMISEAEKIQAAFDGMFDLDIDSARLGNVLFTSGAPHSNLGSAALSTAAMQSGVTAMREQTNFAGKRLGLRPSFLIVPPELEFVAMVVTKSAGIPGSVNNDINPMLGYVTPIVSPQLTNTSQWFYAADPKIIDTIEIGFVGGQVNPALFVQDQPLFGLNFTQDVISYQVRQEYGGAVMDYRGLYRGI